MVGELKLEEVMPGVQCIAQPTIKIAVVVNSAYPASGVHREIQQITANKSNGL
jgi:hypothetical protein